MTFLTQMLVCCCKFSASSFLHCCAVRSCERHEYKDAGCNCVRQRFGHTTKVGAMREELGTAACINSTVCAVEQHLASTQVIRITNKLQANAAMRVNHCFNGTRCSGTQR